MFSKSKGHLGLVVLFLFLVIDSIVSCSQQDMDKRSHSSREDTSSITKRLTRRIAYGLLFANPSPQTSVMPTMPGSMYGMQYYPQSMDPYMMSGAQQQAVYPSQQQQQHIIGNPWSSNPYAYASMPSASNPSFTAQASSPMSLLFSGGGYPLFSNILGR